MLPLYEGLKYVTLEGCLMKHGSFDETVFQRVSKGCQILRIGFEKVSKEFSKGLQRVPNELPKPFQRA